MSSIVAPGPAVRRWGAGTAAAVRLLVASDVAVTGVAIAATVGVTQPRVSQILKRLAAQQAVQAGADGYIGDRGRLLDLYLARSKPHLVEPETYWYSTRPLEDQAQRLVAVAASHGIGIAFSADLGPDLIAPWRHPTVTVAYADSLLPADEAGLVPAEGRGDASLILRWTGDPTLLSPSPPWATEAAGLPIVDPCQQWRDLHDLGGEDRAEAAGRLRTAILQRSITRTP